jgi:LysM repeat protein
MLRRLLTVTALIIILTFAGASKSWAEDLVYTVQPGDNLFRIGLRYGVDWRRIMAANGLGYPTIYVGQRLLIPGATEAGPLPAATPAPVAPAPTPAPEPPGAAAPGDGTYTVRQGDTLWSITRQLGLSISELIAANRAVSPNRIYPGQVLHLPPNAGTAASVSASAPSTPAEPAPIPAADGQPVDLTGLPQVSARAREIYQHGLALGNNPRAFAKIGDCNATLPSFLAAFDSGTYRLGGPYAYLQETIQQFSGSFARDSKAVHIGYTAYDITSPEWADPRVCQPGETPELCEYRLQRPSIALISLGTNDWSHGVPLYEKNMRTIVEQSIAAGILPILSTKADNTEGYHLYNGVIRRLAAEYDVPLWDFWLIAQRLPGGGLLPDGFHLTGGANTFLRPESIYGAWPWRNLTALETLDIVWRGVR